MVLDPTPDIELKVNQVCLMEDSCLHLMNLSGLETR